MFIPLKREPVPQIQNRLCRRIRHLDQGTEPLDPLKDLASKDDFKANARRSTLMDEYLSSGLGKTVHTLKNYNSMKYPKNSPYGLEMRVLSSDPMTNRINLSIPSQRQKLYKYLKLNQTSIIPS